MTARLADWRRIGIGCGAAMFLCMALGRFSYSTMIPALVEQSQMTPIAAGYIGGANLIGYLLGAIVSITIARQFELRTLMTVAVCLAVAALIGSALNFGILWLGFWRMVIGVMAGFVMVQSLSLMTLFAPADKRPQAASYVFIGVGFGILFTGTAVPALMTQGLAITWWGIALVGAIAGAVSLWALQTLPLNAKSDVPQRKTGTPSNLAWYALVFASFLFSLGIVPHTIYWFDFLARWLQQGYQVAGAHWFVVGLFGIIGPVFATTLARGVGTAIATALIFFILAIGIAAPAFAISFTTLAISSLIFGMQPGVSTMIAARARDLGTARQTPEMMRTTIIANGVGAAAGGIAVPALLDATGSYYLLFLAGGAAFVIGGLICLPFLGVRAEE